MPNLFCLFLGFLVRFDGFYFKSLSLPLIVVVFCCGCSFLFSIVWKSFSVISFLYCIIIFLSLAGVWFYTSFDDSFILLF